VVENGFRRIYNSREFQAKKSLGTLCRATLVKLHFFLTLLLQKVFVQMMMMRGEGERKSSLFSKPSRAADLGLKSPRERTNWDSLLLICGWVLCANGMEWETKTINLTGS
jgi:hypothetical protein